MRHSFSPGPVTPHSSGVHPPAALTARVAPAGVPDRLAACPQGAAAAAVDLPPVAAAADVRLATAARTGPWQGSVRNPHTMGADGIAGPAGRARVGSSKGNGAGGLLR